MNCSSARAVSRRSGATSWTSCPSSTSAARFGLFLFSLYTHRASMLQSMPTCNYDANMLTRHLCLSNHFIFICQMLSPIQHIDVACTHSFFFSHACLHVPIPILYQPLLHEVTQFSAYSLLRDLTLFRRSRRSTPPSTSTPSSRPGTRRWTSSPATRRCARSSARPRRKPPAAAIW